MLEIFRKELAEPLLRLALQVLNLEPGQPEGLSGFLIGHADEKAAIHDRDHAAIDLCQLTQRLVDLFDEFRIAADRQLDLVNRNPLRVAFAALGRYPRLGVIKGDLPHRPRSDRAATAKKCERSLKLNESLSAERRNSSLTSTVGDKLDDRP